MIDYKKIQVTQPDGSVWEGELDAKGVLSLTDMIQPPEQQAQAQQAPEEQEEQEEQQDSAADALAQAIAQIGGTPDTEQDYDDEDEGDDWDEEDNTPDLDKVMKDGAFRERLASVMLDNKYDRRLRGRTRGKLDMKALFKVPTQSRSVFTQKQARKNKEYNIVLLIDESGSMAGSKARKAAEVAVFLAKNFDGLNLNLAIIGFNNVIAVHKDFGMSSNYNDLYKTIRSLNHGAGSGNNNDYDGMSRAYDMFKHTKEGKNVLLMLSDGSPTQSHYSSFLDVKGDPEKHIERFYNQNLTPEQKKREEHLHHLVNSNKDVVSIGIGIEEGGWQIPNHFVINDLKELKPRIIKELKRNIKRG